MHNISQILLSLHLSIFMVCQLACVMESKWVFQLPPPIFSNTGFVSHALITRSEASVENLYSLLGFEDANVHILQMLKHSLALLIPFE